MRHAKRNLNLEKLRDELKSKNKLAKGLRTKKTTAEIHYLKMREIEYPLSSQL